MQTLQSINLSNVIFDLGLDSEFIDHYEYLDNEAEEIELEIENLFDSLYA